MPDLGNEPRVKMKICAVGDQAVGKTSLVHRFVADDFAGDYIRTIGTLINKKTLEVGRPEGESVVVDAVIWDIMGNLGFMRLLRDAYFYKAHGVFAVLDLTRRDTLEGLRVWLRAVCTIVDSLPIVILANKSDLEEKREVSRVDVATLSEAYEAPYYLTCPKTGDDVSQGFEALIKLALDRMDVSHAAPIEGERVAEHEETSDLSIARERPLGHSPDRPR